MRKTSKAKNPFVGLWRIVSMSAWEEGYLDEGGPAYFELNVRGGGEFRFGYVQGFVDYRLTTRDDEPAIEWSWDGNDEMEPAQGRGWAVLIGKELCGMVFFHEGDESEFVARKSTAVKRVKRK